MWTYRLATPGAMVTSPTDWKTCLFELSIIMILFIAALSNSPGLSTWKCNGARSAIAACAASELDSAATETPSAVVEMNCLRETMDDPPSGGCTERALIRLERMRPWCSSRAFRWKAAVAPFPETAIHVRDIGESCGAQRARGAH